MPDPVTGTIAAVATIGGGYMQGQAAKSAARTQADAANRAMNQEMAMYERSREDLTPYRESGYTALKDIERMKPFLLGRFNQPYQYTLPPTQAPTTGAAPQVSPGGPAESFAPRSMPANYQEARDAFERQRQEQIANDPFGRISAAVVGNDQFGQQFGYAADADAFNQFYNQNYGTPAPASDMAGGGTQMMPISGPSSPFEEYLDPSMAFRMRLGTQATERMANVGGGAISGNTLRALTDYGQNLASTEYGNAFNRFQTERGNIYNTLANIAGMGQSAVNTGVNAGQNFAATQTGLITGQAAANAAGTVGQANAYGGALNNLSNYAMLNSIMKPQTPTEQLPIRLA
jgi:hypothetical protein